MNYRTYMCTIKMYSSQCRYIEFPTDSFFRLLLSPVSSGLSSWKVTYCIINIFPENSNIASPIPVSCSNPPVTLTSCLWKTLTLAISIPYWTVHRANVYGTDLKASQAEPVTELCEQNPNTVTEEQYGRYIAQHTELSTS